MQLTKEKRKGLKTIAVIAGCLFVINFVSAVVLYSQISVTSHVSEALSTETLDLDFSGYPGETITKTFIVENEASVSLNTQITWEETVNDDEVSYTTDMPKTIELEPGNNEVSIEFTYDADTETGDVFGTVTLTRTD